MSTKIPYCDETWNVFVGCPLPVKYEGCHHCWARESHNIRHKAYLAGKQLPEMYAKPFEELQFFPERLEQPLQWKKPRTIFIESQGDLFHPNVPFIWISKIINIITQCPQHTFLIITKNADRLYEFSRKSVFPVWTGLSSWPDNVIGLTTVWDQESADNNIPKLFQCGFKRTGINAEPCLGNIKLYPDYLPIYQHIGTPCGITKPDYHRTKHPCKLDWVVVGCESGQKRRPCKLEWIESMVSQCHAANVPVFVKQVEINGKVVHDVKKFPESICFQEIPNTND